MSITALAVRFLTRRYIGEYDHQSDNRYKHEVLVDNEPVLYEILDTCPKNVTEAKIFLGLSTLMNRGGMEDEMVFNTEGSKAEDEYPSNEIYNWADGVLLVYSITDRRSFGYVKRVATMLATGDYDLPLYIVANKNDMVHLRQISSDEGAILARDADCGFAEVAAAEQVLQVAAAFHELCKAVLAARRKSKHSLLERMLGTRSSNLKLYARGKSDSALPKD